MTLSNRALGHLQHLVGEELPSAERYALGELVGRGGMGIVYRAHDTLLDRDVAVKVLDARAAIGVEAAERLRREAGILAQLEHPGIVPVHDIGALPDGRMFYVMRLVRGQRLDELAATGATRGDVLRLMLRLCQTVAFANAQGVIHRDLKPGNIMIGPFGEVLVLDWGVAKILAANATATADSTSAVSLSTLSVSTLSESTLSESTLSESMVSAAAEPSPANVSVPSRSTSAQKHNAIQTADGAVVGTPGYMSPEQQSGDSARVDQTADVFALGVMLGELLANTHESDNAKLPRPLAAIVARATAEHSSNRYRSALELADDIRRWMDGQAVSAYREHSFERMFRLYQQHQTAVLLVVTYLVVRTVILLWRHI